MNGGLEIHNNSNNDIVYTVGGSSSAFLFIGDTFQVFIIIAAVLIIALGVAAFRKKKRDSDHLDRRAKILRNEFSAVKEESSIQNEDNWIKKRLDGDSDDLDEMIIANKK